MLISNLVYCVTFIIQIGINGFITMWHVGLTYSYSVVWN